MVRGGVIRSGGGCRHRGSARRAGAAAAVRRRAETEAIGRGTGGGAIRHDRRGATEFDGLLDALSGGLFGATALHGSEEENHCDQGNGHERVREVDTGGHPRVDLGGQKTGEDQSDDDRLGTFQESQLLVAGGSGRRHGAGLGFKPGTFFGLKLFMR